MPLSSSVVTAAGWEMLWGRCDIYETDDTFGVGAVFVPFKKSLEKGKRKQWLIISFLFGVNIKINDQPYYFSKQHLVAFQNLSASPQNKTQPAEFVIFSRSLRRIANGSCPAEQGNAFRWRAGDEAHALHCSARSPWHVGNKPATKPGL